MFTKIANNIYDKWHEKSDEIICSLLFALIFLLMYCDHLFLPEYVFSMYKDETFIGTMINGLLLLIAIFSIIGKRHKRNYIDKPFAIAWLIFGVMIAFCAVFIKPGKGYLSLSMALLIVFPILMFIWLGRQDYESLFVSISVGFEIAFIVIAIECFWLYPISSKTLVNGMYIGPVLNSNAFGMLLENVITGALYLFYIKKGNRYFHSLVIAIASGFIYLSASRCAALAVILQIIVFLLFYIKYEICLCSDKRNMFKAKVLPIVLTGAMILGSVFVIDDICRKDPLNDSGTIEVVKETTIVEKTKIKNEKAVKKIEQQQDDKNIQEKAEAAIPKQTTKDALDVLSSGRISIWEMYLKKISIKGHSLSERLRINPTEAGVHNDYIEFAYAAGAPAGILYLALLLIALIKTLSYFIKRKEYSSYMVFSAMSVIGFMVYSMLEIQISPVSRGAVLLYYIGIIPMFEKRGKKITDGDL